MGKCSGLSPPPLDRSTRRQIVDQEFATEPYNPHLPVDERGNDGRMERRRERKGGRMMEWLLNIQQAGRSMQGVVGRLQFSISYLSLFLILALKFPSSGFFVPCIFVVLCHYTFRILLSLFALPSCLLFCFPGIHLVSVYLY